MEKVVITVCGDEELRYGNTVFLADCFKIQNHLKKFYGFSSDQTSDDWESYTSASSLLSYLRKIGSNENTKIVFFYYSGHGTNNEGSEFPKFRLRNDPEYVTMESIMDALGEKKLIISVFDCCNNVPKPKDYPKTQESGEKKDSIFGDKSLLGKIIDIYEGKIWICSSSRGRPSYFEGFCMRFLRKMESTFRKRVEEEIGFEAYLKTFFDGWSYGVYPNVVLKPVAYFDRKKLPSIEGFTGNGYYEYENGGRYEGDFVRGKKHGKGVITFSSAGKYVGEFVEDEKSGVGVLYRKDGSKYYEGEFKENKMNGKGTYTGSNGNIYVGEFRDNKSNGFGTMKYASGINVGIRYEGEWKDGKRCGKGKETHKNETTILYEGEYENDEKNGVGKLFRGNGTLYYEGEFSDGKMAGKGVYHASNGNRFEAEFENGIISGSGTMFYKNGDRYEGKWKEGKFEGKGTYYYKDGRVENREYKDGKKV